MTLDRACEIFYERVQKYTHKKLFYNPHAAEVATQNTFLALTEQWDQLDHENIEPWIMKTAKNCVLKEQANHTRRNKKLAKLYDETKDEDPNSDVFQQMMDRLLEPKFEKCYQEVMAQLSDRDKILLKFLRKEMKLKEVAEELGISQAAASSGSVRVHKKVMEIVEKVLEENGL